MEPAGYVGRGGIGGGDTMCDFRVIAHRTTTCAEAAMIVSRINCAETRCEAAVALYGVCVDVDEEEGGELWRSWVGQSKQGFVLGSVSGQGSFPVQM